MKITQKCLIWILTLKYGKNCILSFLCRFLARKFKRFSYTSISKTEKKITFLKLSHLNFDVQKKNVKIICFNFLIFILGAKIQTHFLKKNENMVTFVATNNFPNWHWNSITIFGNVEECVLSTMKLDDAFQSTLLFKGSLSIRKMKRYGSFLEKRYASTVKW